MSPLEKQEKAALLSLTLVTNKVKMDYSMGRIKTFQDYLYTLGHSVDYMKNVLQYRDNELSKTLTFPELKSHLDDLRISLTTEWWLKKNPPIIEHEPDTIRTETSQEVTSLATRDTIIPEEDKDYGLSPSEKEKCFLFWFQKKHAKQLLDGIIKDHKHAQLLIAAAGHGKTFVLGAVLRRLLDMGFHNGKTISPWPYFYITKASVVEQTKRVLEQKFSIDTRREVTVTNYDQLRATLGELYIEEKTIIREGIEHIELHWRPMIHPIVFVVDESQSAKNRDSQQSKIIRAISEINNPNIYCIFSSATPFTRVSEAEYFVVNAKIEDRLF